LVFIERNSLTISGSAHGKWNRKPCSNTQK
jgi:hypothetical protein